ncbi:DUF2533 family protein [Desertibacillus haloalkaliphilus]|uniref:DUF2533 family protein n=1 Tax=Desertibacillus haloalkaliphilus TaxID=1328930 RepID=UPI001C25E939|nr:DUF2533 family protein [Desertibacillus haloalkaliphilus]MBU8905617.1 YpbS family protein [Desertibacillus haloalkaliphilus]
MSVHLEIGKQVNKQLQAKDRFLELDRKREEAIEVTLEQAKRTNEFSTKEINEYTEEINQLSKQFSFIPSRKKVTKAMVLEYLQKQN